MHPNPERNRTDSMSATTTSSSSSANLFRGGARHTIPDIDQYTIEFSNNTLILHPKIRHVETDELATLSFTHSKIIQCTIQHTKTISANRTKYRQILADVFGAMPWPWLRDNTSFNIELTDKHGVAGYNWNEELGMSIQGKDATGTLKEIVHFVELNKYSMDIVIELASEETVRIVR
jgi:hypothetical protein